MIEDSFLCGFESLLGFEVEQMPIIKVDKFKNIENVLNLIDGERTLLEIGKELGLSKKIVSNCIYKLRDKIKKIGSRKQSTIYVRKNILPIK